MTLLLGFYHSDFWYFGWWTKKLFLISTPIFQIMWFSGDMLQDLHERKGITIESEETYCEN